MRESLRWVEQVGNGWKSCAGGEGCWGVLRWA